MFRSRRVCCVNIRCLRDGVRVCLGIDHGACEEEARRVEAFVESSMADVNKRVDQVPGWTCEFCCGFWCCFCCGTTDKAAAPRSLLQTNDGFVKIPGVNLDQ